MSTQQTLNQYVGTDVLGVGTTIVAEDMTTAASVYAGQKGNDPIILQRTKSDILCVLPDSFTTFTAEAYDPTGAAAAAGCAVTPARYTVLAGTKVIFTATAAEGWTFSKWQFDEADIEQSGEESKDVAYLAVPASPTILRVRAVFTMA